MLLSAIQTLAVLFTAAALIHPPWRPRAAAVLAVLAAASLSAAALALGAEPRTLDVTHSFTAYIGNELDHKDFPIETTTAGAWAWPLVAAAWCGLWAALLWRIRRREGRPIGASHPFWTPLLFAWSGLAAILVLEKSAAPSSLVQTFAFDRILFPVTVAAALLLALRCRSVMLTLSWLTLFMTLTRLPLVIFGTLATQGHWGTSLDVHSMVHFANPLAQRVQVVEPGSTEQLGWILWAPHLLVFPALYMMSAGGFALALLVLAKSTEQKPGQPERAA